MTTLTEYIEQNRLIRHRWSGTDAQGRETACLLAALSPEVRKARDPKACPASIMPAWLAYLTPWIDDAGSSAQWPTVIRRYADLSARWHVLSAAQWAELEREVKILTVREARQHVTADSLGVRDACDAVIAALASEDSMRLSAALAAARAAALAAAGAADRIIDGILTLIETAVEKQEAAR